MHVLRDVESPQLGNTRDLVVYLPPTHGEPNRSFPVVYMHDGQNLSEWRVEETMDQLAREGIEAIVVGIPVEAENRRHEYAQEGARDYLAFIVDTVRPIVEQEFAADGRREARGLLGSSLGGVISLHGLYAHPDTFGFAGVLSPAFWWNGDDRWFELVEQNEPPRRADLHRRRRQRARRGRGDAAPLRRRLRADDRPAAAARLRGPARSARCSTEAAPTTRDDWARRLPDALRFLLTGRAP